MYTKTRNLTTNTDEHYNPHAGTEQSWCSDDSITMDDIHSTRVTVRGEAADGPDTPTPTSSFCAFRHSQNPYCNEFVTETLTVTIHCVPPSKDRRQLVIPHHVLTNQDFDDLVSIPTNFVSRPLQQLLPFRSRQWFRHQVGGVHMRTHFSW